MNDDLPQPDPDDDPEAGAAEAPSAAAPKARKARAPKAPKAPKEPKPPKAARAKQSKETLEPQTDPQAPLDPKAFLTAARPVLQRLEADLLTRSRASEGVQRTLKARHTAEREAHRTAEAFPEWERQLVGQIAAAWILSMVFVRILEDRGLSSKNRIAGPGAADSEATFYTLGPSLTPRDYLRTVFTELTHFAAGRDLFDARHNPVWLLGPSADASRALLELFRAPSPETPAFRFGQPDTRFLGDLYQDLSEEVRERFALLQTPAFVERYILDHTLEPAIAHFGLDATTIIDPTCGSGHFLLGAFERLLDHWQREHPGDDRRKAIAAALDRVYGSDLNPYAVAIARFRLTLAMIEKGGYTHLREVPNPKLHLAVADSLLHGASKAQTELGDLAGQVAADWKGRLFELEDEEAARDVLDRQHTAVVGNPPYITVKDAARREEYRARYPTAYRQYSLGVPFTEKFFRLARHAGYVGMITANSFMKREFGKKLIEDWVKTVNLTGVINTAGAYIPGHGTPTVILFGTQEPPKGDSVWAILGKRGEPSTPDDPEQGLVWRSIADHGHEVGFENDYLSVADVPRATLQKHPWSLGGGGAAELKELLEERAERRLGDFAEIGLVALTRADDIYLAPPGTFHRMGIASENIVTLVHGESVRDWAIVHPLEALFPYDQPDLVPTASEAVRRVLWPYRTPLWLRREPNGDHREIGLPWHVWSRFQRARYGRPLSITFAFVATHNHFVLDHGGKVFKQSAPVIKLPPEATEDDHYALLAYLNSSTACFWMKQVCMNKGATSHKGVLQADEDKFRYEFDGTKLAALPIPPIDSLAPLAPLAKRISALVQTGSASAYLAAMRDAESPEQVVRQLARLEGESEAASREAIALQEELDWRVYQLFGLAGDDQVALVAVPPAYEADERPFTSDAIPALAPRRAAARDGQLAILESPEFKRRWYRSQGKFQAAAVTDTTIQRQSLDELLAERVEGRIAAVDRAQSQRDLTSDLQGVVALYAPTIASLVPDIEPSGHLAALIESDSVPFLAAYRYTEKGLEKRAAWERTWDLQRREDAGENVGDIPVPPKYDPKDFRDAATYRLRGKLDVPKERFISYPGCEGDDDKSPLYGWAGWTHLQQAQALSALYMQRKQEAWTPDRLTPLLAGLQELIPWLKQWHNAPAPDFNDLKLGDYFESFLEGELKALDLTQEDLKSWRPQTKRRGSS